MQLDRQTIESNCTHRSNNTWIFAVCENRKEECHVICIYSAEEMEWQIQRLGMHVKHLLRLYMNVKCHLDRNRGELWIRPANFSSIQATGYHPFDFTRVNSQLDEKDSVVCSVTSCKYFELIFIIGIFVCLCVFKLKVFAAIDFGLSEQPKFCQKLKLNTRIKPAEQIYFGCLEFEFFVSLIFDIEQYQLLVNGAIWNDDFVFLAQILMKQTASMTFYVSISLLSVFPRTKKNKQVHAMNWWWFPISNTCYLGGTSKQMWLLYMCLVLSEKSTNTHFFRQIFASLFEPVWSRKCLCGSYLNGRITSMELKTISLKRAVWASKMEWRTYQNGYTPKKKRCVPVHVHGNKGQMGSFFLHFSHKRIRV